LIDSSQNVDDSVAVKCSELQKATENLIQELKEKKTMLTQAIELHKRLDTVIFNFNIYIFQSPAWLNHYLTPAIKLLRQN